jgi:hypothetical protein
MREFFFEVAFQIERIDSILAFQFEAQLKFLYWMIDSILAFQFEAQLKFLYWILCHEIEEFDPELKGISTGHLPLAVVKWPAFM